MIDKIKIKNIAAYFDEDFLNIIYKDLKSENIEIDKGLFENFEKNIDTEIHIFELNNYKIGSIGYTSRELDNLKINYQTMKYISNDYNGPKPSYKVAFVKIIFEKENGKILGFQIANESNIQKRLDCIKTLIDNKLGINELAKAKIYSDSDINPDILNIAALMAINKSLNLIDIKEVEAEDIESLTKNDNVFLDVREDYEFEAGHIKGSINIPLRNLMSSLNSLPKNKNIYVYCRTGHRSLDAVSFLESLGIKNAYNVKGGFIELSLNEFRKDEGNLEKSILTKYNFE